MGEEIVRSTSRELRSDGIAMGYRYDGSPIVCPDASEPPPMSVTEYVQSTFPGARAPHALLDDGRSTLDLFGRSYVLMRLGRGAPDIAPSGARESGGAGRSKRAGSAERPGCPDNEGNSVSV